MITRATFRDFQSLADVELDLAPFTVVVGPSSSGKSAVARALKILSSNARGNDFVSSWAKHSEISVTTEEGPSVTLMKGEGKGVYLVDEEKFTRLAGGVPEAVTQALNVHLS